jgi:nicotinamidase/pyrazinamidase
MKNKALILLDIQNDFLPGGALAVPNGDTIIPIANALMDQDIFGEIIATQDWHPENHSSFESLWPTHCVQGSHGAALAATLNKDKITKIIYKGENSAIDSYSAFFDNERQQKTMLDGYLKNKNIEDLYIMGLATDYCVKFTVLDALHLNYNVTVIENGCRGIHDAAGALEEMEARGARRVRFPWE